MQAITSFTLHTAFKKPGPLLWLACLLGAMLAGAVWGLVPGFLLAVCNVKVVFGCFLMFFIGMLGV